MRTTSSRRRRRKRSAGGILKIRNEIEKLRKRIGSFEDALERFRDEPVLVGIDRQIAALIGVEGLNRAEIRRIFEHDVIAGIEEDFTDQIEALLRPVDDRDASDSKLRSNRA